MTTTPVCVHGWPIFDVDPCPDCLRATEKSVTAPVIEDGGDNIPEFMRRDTGTVAAPQEGGSQTPVGEACRPDEHASPPLSDKEERGPGSVARRLGYPEHPDDALVREQIASGEAARNAAKTKERLIKAGFVKREEAPYRMGSYGIERKP